MVFCKKNNKNNPSNASPTENQPISNPSLIQFDMQHAQKSFDDSPMGQSSILLVHLFSLKLHSRFQT